MKLTRVGVGLGQAGLSGTRRGSGGAPDLVQASETLSVDRGT